MPRNHRDDASGEWRGRVATPRRRPRAVQAIRWTSKPDVPVDCLRPWADTSRGSRSAIDLWLWLRRRRNDTRTKPEWTDNSWETKAACLRPSEIADQAARRQIALVPLGTVVLLASRDTGAMSAVVRCPVRGGTGCPDDCRTVSLSRSCPSVASRTRECSDSRQCLGGQDAANRPSVFRGGSGRLHFAEKRIQHQQTPQRRAVIAPASRMLSHQPIERRRLEISRLCYGAGE